nr:hypothetical protein [Nostoc sp. TCL26-01]
MNQKDESNRQVSRQEKGTARKRVKAINSSSAGGQSISEPESQGIGVQRPQCNDSSFSEWGYRSERDDKPVDANLGKVLEHLGNLESRFYSYVHAHQERLDIRRKESENAELEFQEEARELREKILALLGEQDSETPSPAETTEIEEKS